MLTVEELTDGNVDDITPDDVFDGEFCIPAGGAPTQGGDSPPGGASGGDIGGAIEPETVPTSSDETATSVPGDGEGEGVTPESQETATTTTTMERAARTSPTPVGESGAGGFLTEYGLVLIITGLLVIITLLVYISKGKW